MHPRPSFILMTLTLSSLCHAAAQQKPANQIKGQITDAQITQAIDHFAPAMIGLRHQVHQHPELSNREVETSKLVALQLRAFGLDVQTGIAHTGVVGILKGAKPGPVVAVRSELDALPVTEDTDLPFKSTDRTTYNGQEVGVAHACGHDIHVAAILGVAAVLASMRDQLPGTIMFIFQPAEEGAPEGEEGGAELMLKEGIFNKINPEAIFGMHSVGNLNVGQLRYWLGPSAASDAFFKIEFHGKQAHAAFPQESIDPVIMAAEAVLELQTIRTRNLAASDAAIMSVSTVNAGVRPNITPDHGTLGGIIRTFDDKVDKKIQQRMGEIVNSIAQGNGGSVELHFYDQVPVLVSDPALVKRMLPALDRTVGATNVAQVQPVPAADDFAFFGRHAPEFFFQLGTQKPGTTSGFNHTANFNADDSSIPIGMHAMTAVLLDYLDSTPAR